MCTFEVLPLSVDIVNYLVPRWHVSSTSVICLRFMGKDDLGYITDLPMSIISKILLVLDNWYSHHVIGIDNHLYIGFCVSFVFLASYESIFNMSSVFIDIEKVMIPSCAFCI